MISQGLVRRGRVWPAESHRHMRQVEDASSHARARILTFWIGRQVIAAVYERYQDIRNRQGPPGKEDLGCREIIHRNVYNLYTDNLHCGVDILETLRKQIVRRRGIEAIIGERASSNAISLPPNSIGPLPLGRLNVGQDQLEPSGPSLRDPGMNMYRED